MKSKNGYEEGGFLDDGASVDAVSGNEVPTGSLQSEVRDDIPTQLSEGEFVIPADVVRFIGLEKLMKIRATAKAGLSAMEEEGQIGGQPAPMELDEDGEMDALIDGLDGEDFEGAIQNFAEGGSISKMPSYKKYMGREFGKTQQIEFRTFINASGDKIVIKFVDGQPLRPIPEGYSPYVEGDTPEAPPEGEGVTGTSGGDGGGSTMQKNDPNNPWKGITAPGDSDAIKEHHQIRSDRVTRDRAAALKDLGEQFKDETSSTMVNKQMQNYMTPDALEIFNTRGTNKDSWEWSLLKNKTPAELAIWAQKTADTIRRTSGLPDPFYTGEPEGNMGKVGEFFSEAFSGGGDILDIIKRVGVIAIGSGVGIPSFIMNELYDKAGGDKAVVDDAIAQQGATVETSSGSGTTELEDALNIQKDLTVKLQDAEDRGDSITAQKNTAAAEWAGKEAQSDAIQKATLEALATQKGEWDAESEAYTTKLADAEITRGNVADNHALQLSVQKEDAETKYNEISAALKGSEGKTDAITLALQAAKDKAAEDISSLSTQLLESNTNLSTQKSAWDTSEADWDVKQGDWDTVNKEWSGKVDQSNAIQAALQEDLANTKQALADSQQAVQDKDVALSNKDAELQAAINSRPNTPPPGTGTTTPVTPPKTPPATGGVGHPSAGSGGGNNGSGGYTPPSDTGGGGGGGGGYTGGWGNSGYSQKKAMETGNGYLNKGGLIRKEDTPTIKKMRSDNTTGLAAKKKSKERAKAKKGALAAKRT